MRKSRYILAMAFLWLCTLSAADAKVRLPKVISDCMVLQRNVELNVWGWADPGENVTVRFDGQHFFTRADASGNWSVKMPAHKEGGPYLLEVNEIIIRDVLVGDVWLLSGQSNQETPIERLTDRYPEINVSNNHMIRMYKVPTQNTPGVLNEDILAGDRWHSGVASDIMNWKALAYFFAVETYEKTGVPQGMLVSSLGGSAIESWIAEEYLLQIPEMARQKAEAEAQQASMQDKGQAGGWQKENLDDSDWAEVMEPEYLDASGIENGVIWFRKTVEIPESMVGRHAKIYMGRIVDGDEVFVNGVLVGSTSYFGPPRKYDIPAGLLHSGKNVVAVRLTANAGDAGFVPDKSYRIQGDEAAVELSGTWKYKVGRAAGAGGRPGFGAQGRGGFTGAGLYNGMIYPVRNYNIAGVMWYQGETNTVRCDEYEPLLTKLIENWRADFGDPQLPFLICQLPNYMDKYDYPTDSDWARVREAQFNVSKKIPATSLAVSFKFGEWNDIHPLNKKDLAKTLMYGVRSLHLHEKLVASGPVYESMRIDGNKVIITFSSTGGGLRTSDGEALKHFAIAGADRKFVWADAVIKGNTVIVSSPEVQEPAAVRYAWADNPEDANLMNKEGLLASPFRTDSWEYIPNPARRRYSY